MPGRGQVPAFLPRRDPIGTLASMQLCGVHQECLGRSTDGECRHHRDAPAGVNARRQGHCCGEI